ncbi:MAG: alpha/beta hydrolase [Candidatus Marinimicrobia bacterium]|nr:alpha/beta hydrolase [Candidatus Neomarinimicrobiota bacterium]MBL7113221.1 alpha/beta hydrolase [Bacteroidales bacterium]
MAGFTFSLNRPSDTKIEKSQNYIFRDVSYPVNEGTISGTLTIPLGNDYPLLILIPGGGKHDRDYTVFNHKPFLVIANQLATNGIATLRYDERGAGKSASEIDNLTISEKSEDIQRIINCLNQDNELSINQIGLLGHSEGGMVSMQTAAQSPAISFMILLGTPGLNGEEYQLQFEQVSGRARGLNESAISDRTEIQQQVFKILKTYDHNTAMEHLEVLYHNLSPPVPENRIMAAVKRLNSPAFRSNLEFDPGIYLNQIKCPVLALFAEFDYHVPADRNMLAVIAALEGGGNSDFLVDELDGLNHFFQTADPNNPFGYDEIDEAIAAPVLDTLVYWINKRIRP